ncbi:tetratricopeptide repeat protein [bacterium]|nr:tetratricopeptide repeat protein [bacterium]
MEGILPDLPDDINSKIMELEALVETQPSAETYSQLADMYRTNGQLELATETCEKAIALFPDNVDCLMTYARVLLDSGLFEEAEALLEKIIKLGGEEAGTLIMMGQLYVKRNDLAGIHSIATKLAENFKDDVRAKKFLGFLKTRNLLPAGISTEEDKKTPPVSILQEVPIISPDNMPSEEGIPSAGQQYNAEEETTEAPAEKTIISSVEKKKPEEEALRKTRRKLPPQKTVTTVSVEEMMRLLAMLKGIVGVQHVILVDPMKKTMASKGCPTIVARAIGGLVRSLSRAMYVAFDALEFGEWNKGVMELEQTTVHLIRVEGYWIALLCDTSVSLGALRIAVNSIVNKQIKTKNI